MTGWQSGGGDQGGWNPNQSFGPEAQTSRYDPYGYGSDPYPGNSPYDSYTADPYGAGYDPYGQYQQQYPPTGGFPAPGYGPPPPEKRSKLPMILSLVAIVIIIGAVVAIVLVNRADNQPVADPTSSSTPPPSSGSKTSSSSKAPPSPSGEHGDWLSIDNTADSGLSYQVPPEWQESSSPIASGLEVDFTGAANYGIYDCEGGDYVRTFAASGDVQGKNGQDLDLATTLKDFAESFAKQGYGENAQVDVPTPKEVKVGDTTAMTVTAKVKITPEKPNCQATDAEVALVGLPRQADGEPKGVAMLVVVNDLGGGPGDPKPLDPSVTQEILGTVQLS